METAYITLTTDFGTQDGFAGTMKGVILSIHPRAVIVDITHEIEAQDIFGAALTLSRSCRSFPRGTIHVAVVDPGVGGSRRPLLLQTKKHYFVGPDNGLFSFVAEESEVVRAIELTEEKIFQIELGQEKLEGVRYSYNEVSENAPLAIFGSSGLLEICVNRGNARQQLGLVRGDPVRVRLM